MTVVTSLSVPIWASVRKILSPSVHKPIGWPKAAHIPEPFLFPSSPVPVMTVTECFSVKVHYLTSYLVGESCFSVWKWSNCLYAGTCLPCINHGVLFHLLICHFDFGPGSLVIPLLCAKTRYPWVDKPWCSHSPLKTVFRCRFPCFGDKQQEQISKVTDCHKTSCARCQRWWPVKFWWFTDRDENAIDGFPQTRFRPFWISYCWKKLRKMNDLKQIIHESRIPQEINHASQAFRYSRITFLFK